jgi:hypothetical protein
MRWPETKQLVRCLLDASLALLVACIPLGTRYVFRWGNIADVPVEYGTVSLWATQLLAFVYVAGVAMARNDALRAVIPAEAGTHAAAVCHDGSRFVLRRQAAWALIGCFAAASVAAALSFHPLDAFQHLGWFALIAVLVWAVSRHRPDPRLILRALVAGGVLQALLALWQFGAQEVAGSTFLGIAPHLPSDLGASIVGAGAERVLRAYGAFSHPNMLGGYLALALLASVWLAWEKWSSRTFFVPVGIIAAGLFVSFSRGAWLAVVAGMSTMVVFEAWRAGMRKVAAKFLVPLALIALVALQLTRAHLPLVQTRVTATAVLEQRSVGERVTFAHDAWRLFLRHPLVGVGPGQMPAAVRAEIDASREGWSYQPAHSVLLVALAETGAVGFGALLVMIAIGAQVLWWRLQACDAMAPFATGVCSVLMVVGSVDHYLWSFWPGVLLVAVSVTSIGYTQE